MCQAPELRGSPLYLVAGPEPHPRRASPRDRAPQVALAPLRVFPAAHVAGAAGPSKDPEDPAAEFPGCFGPWGGGKYRDQPDWALPERIGLEGEGGGDLGTSPSLPTVSSLPGDW